MLVRQRHIKSVVRTRHGFALVATLLLLTLLIAVSAQMATQACVESAASARRHRTLLHELALDSAVLRIGEQLAVPDAEALEWIRALDRTGLAFVEWKFGETEVRCSLGDDAAKFNPVLFQRPDQTSILTRKLKLMAERKALRTAEVSLRPLVADSGATKGAGLYRWFDQLLDDMEPGVLFRWTGNDSQEVDAPVWSDVMTFWGDGRIDLRRVDSDVLETVLEDLQPGLAHSMLKARTADRSVNFLPTALIDVPAELRSSVTERIGYDLRRYALRIQTAVGSDRRQWYVVLRADGRSTKVLHRSQPTW